MSRPGRLLAGAGLALAVTAGCGPAPAGDPAASAPPAGAPPAGASPADGALATGAAPGADSAAAGSPAPPGAAAELRPVTAVPFTVLDPVVPGWSAVRSVNRAAVYDVPPSWQVLTETTIIGFETKQGERVAASGAADFGSGICGPESSSLALAGVKHDTASDLARAAEGTVREWADLAYRDDKERRPKLTVGRPEPSTVWGGRAATIVKASARSAAPTGPCKLTGGVVFAVAAGGFSGELGPTVILLVVADTGRDDHVPEPVIRQILGSLRPV